MLQLSAGNAVPSQCRVSNVSDRERRRNALRAIAKRSPLCDGGSQLLEHLLGIFPVDASVCDGNTVLQTFLALLWDLLVACKSS